MAMLREVSLGRMITTDAQSVNGFLVGLQDGREVKREKTLHELLPSVLAASVIIIPLCILSRSEILLRRIERNSISTSHAIFTVTLIFHHIMQLVFLDVFEEINEIYQKLHDQELENGEFNMAYIPTEPQAIVPLAEIFYEICHNKTSATFDLSCDPQFPVALSLLISLCNSAVIFSFAFTLVFIKIIFLAACDLGPRQLFWWSFFQLLQISVMIAKSSHVGGEFYFFKFAGYFPVVVCMLLKSYMEIKVAKDDILKSRIRFVKVLEIDEERTRLKRKIEQSEGALKKLRMKTELTKEQEELVAGAGEQLEKDKKAIKLSSYKLDVERDLVFDKKLGAGAFGIVYKATFHGSAVAVKQLLSEQLSSTNLSRFVLEIQLLAEIHHPNVVQMLAASWEAPHLAIVLEFAKEGDLGVVLVKRKREASWREMRLRWLRQIVRGLSFLHGRNIMHRDLKLENCLIFEYNVLKLSDFGESRFVNIEGDDKELTVVGTPYYIAPEVMRGDIYDESCDVFSFSILLACLGVEDGNVKAVFSEDFREGKVLGAVRRSMMKGIVVSNRHTKGWRANLDSFVTKGGWPKEMKDLVERCWHENRKERPMLAEIVRTIEGWDEGMFDKMFQSSTGYLGKLATSRKTSVADV